ncbi:hypothetical protein QBC32DRAFT_211519 [Pseudoneurospora amorphoporcata]|uniref:Uncharacterized protein n=1 Tax=Pseudoneurospora amorphoporcata TaxID=241081 RepID=A0AAN6NZE7_9PEZI|nr:hypothetical protein QBC32DRAFT_211519 [Pseudoneurospora amorphoporcata]
MASPGAASFSTLSSYASSAPGRSQSHAVNLPNPIAATAPTTTTGTTYLSPSSATSKPRYVQPPLSADAANSNNPSSNPCNNSTNSITPNNTTNHHLLRPRTATQNFKLLPHLETGLHSNSLEDHICQEQHSLHHQDKIHNHPIQEFFSVSTHTSNNPEDEEREPELG